MNVIGRQAIGLSRRLHFGPASLGQKIAIKRVIALAREQRLSPIAALT
jgi:hypothetical protein